MPAEAFIQIATSAGFKDNLPRLLSDYSGGTEVDHEDEEAGFARPRNNGEHERSLIAYADFTQYEQIIQRRDNWWDVFASIFTRRTLAQDSFQRLYPIRVCAHARVVTGVDEVRFHVEMKRLLAAIGIAS